MRRLSPRYSHFFLLLIAISVLSCDDYNIVEPRFYENVYTSNQLWMEFEIYLFVIAIPENCEIGLYLLGSAGEVIEVVYEGYLPAGVHYFEFDWRDENGHKYPDGVYCSLLLGDGFKCMKCVEYDDPEDYLP